MRDLRLNIRTRSYLVTDLSLVITLSPGKFVYGMLIFEQMCDEDQHCSDTSYLAAVKQEILAGK